jgi:hypothetical protein
MANKLLQQTLTIHAGELVRYPLRFVLRVARALDSLDCARDKFAWDLRCATIYVSGWA